MRVGAITASLGFGNPTALLELPPGHTVLDLGSGSGIGCAALGQPGSFSREAQVLAPLNHPNIAHVHGVEETPSGYALIMELVEGETLADRLDRSVASR